MISYLSTTGWLLYVDMNIRKDSQHILTGSDQESAQSLITNIYGHDVDGYIGKNIDLL